MTFDRLAGGPGEDRTAAAVEVFGEGATAEEAYGLLTVDVPAGSWTGALTAARDVLGCTYFDWLSAVDEPGEGFFVAAHLVAVGTPVRRLLVRTRLPYDAPSLPTATGVYAGAAWHERETHEMFGIDFPGHPHLVPLLLPDGFEGHPLRKEFVLAARVAKAWPGAKEPGESEHGGPKRRQMQPPGVPDPNEWGPLKGTLAPEPARPRPARGARAAAGERPARADRPRRARSVSEGSASQAADPGPQAEAPGTAAAESAGTPKAPSERTHRPRSRGADAPWQQAGPAPEAAKTPEATEAPEAPDVPEGPEGAEAGPAKPGPAGPGPTKEEGA